MTEDFEVGGGWQVATFSGAFGISSEEGFVVTFAAQGSSSPRAN